MLGPGSEAESRFSQSSRTTGSWFLEAWGITNFPEFKLQAGEHQMPKSSGPGAGGDVGLLYPKALGLILCPAATPTEAF